MFDIIFGNSYIVVNYEKLYLEETYYTLKNMMEDSSDTISVHVLDQLSGFFSDAKTFEKSKISSYGPN